MREQAPLRSMGDRRRQCGSEDLPGEEALGDKREGYVDPLAEEVVGPPTDLLVLQPLVDGEAVEEDEQREEDRVDEPGRVLVGPGANQVDPIQNGPSPVPGRSYRSCIQPKPIIDALTPMSAISAAMSLIPTSMAMRTTMIDELSEYSIQRKGLRSISSSAWYFAQPGPTT